MFPFMAASAFEANDCAFIADKSSYLVAAMIMTNLPGET